MKKTTLFTVLLTGMVYLISCQKAKLPEPASETNVLEIPMTKKANGGGPYVLNMLIHLSGDNEVPAVNTTAKGRVHIRLTSDRTMYSKIQVDQLEEGDALRFAHVHLGATGVNGPVRIFLAHTADDFGENMVQTLTQEQYDLLLNDAVYANAHSNFYPGGIVRGQIR